MQEKCLREVVTKNQTFTGSRQKIELAHILVLGGPIGKTNQDICSLLKNSFVFEKLDKTHDA